MQSYSFKRGYEQVPIGKAKEVRDELMGIFGITSSPAFFRRMSGRPEPKVSEVKSVESVFHKHGIKEIWGE